MSRNRKIFIQLGEFGDIVNILPLVKREFDRTGIKPLVQTAPEFAPLLEGVSYCDSLVCHRHFMDLRLAVEEARQISRNITVTQVYHRDIPKAPQAGSFAGESWVQGRADVPWGSLPLIFDRRVAAREAELVRRLRPKDRSKPVVLVAMDRSWFIFPHRKLVAEVLAKELGRDFELIDISETKAERVFDFIGLFEQAHCLVASEGALKQLAAATAIPVISLVNRHPTPWHGTPWRPNQVGRFYYDEFPECIPAVLESICGARNPEMRPKIIHAWAGYRRDEIQANSETGRRLALAHQTWQQEYATGYWESGERPHSSGCRTALEIGDPRPVPYVRDIIEHAVALAKKEQDIIALTNADSCFAPGLTGRVLEKISRHQAAFTHRWDFDRLERPLPDGAMLRHGRWFPGSDAFFFSVRWWRTHGHEFGDYLLGREQWDQAMRQLIKFYGGVGIERAIYHEVHDSYWKTDGRESAGNLHNRAQYKAWLERTGLRTQDWQWWKCIEVDGFPPPPGPLGKPQVVRTRKSDTALKMLSKLSARMFSLSGRRAPVSP